MSRGTKVGLAVATVILAVAGFIVFRIQKKKHAGTEVRLEKVGKRDLVSAVTASGKIEAKTSVDISADITGRIIQIAVREGDIVKTRLRWHVPRGLSPPPRPSCSKPRRTGIKRSGPGTEPGS
jgi:hypothetical protein